jgi:hypothetical protein
MRNPWLAIDAHRTRAARAGASPCLGAFSSAATALESATPIADSWRRSHGRRRRPSRDGSAPLVADDDEAAARWEVHPLVSARR